MGLDLLTPLVAIFTYTYMYLIILPSFFRAGVVDEIGTKGGFDPFHWKVRAR